MPAAPLRKNPSIRKRLVPASAAVCAMDALASGMDTLTVCEPHIRDVCEQWRSTAVGAVACSSTLALADDATNAAEQEVPLVVTPSKAANTVGVESRRVAAARKKAALIIDEPDLKQAMDGPYRERCLEAMHDELASLIGHVFGMEIMRDRIARTVTITHRKKISDLLSATGMQGCRTFRKPLAPKEKLKSMNEDPSQEPTTVSELQRYMKVVGGIQYIAVVTRPDIAFAARSLARHMAASAKVHWFAAQHVMRYLQKTVNLGLQFPVCEGNSVVEVYSDADLQMHLV